MVVHMVRWQVMWLPLCPYHCPAAMWPRSQVTGHVTTSLSIPLSSCHVTKRSGDRSCECLPVHTFVQLSCDQEVRWQVMCFGLLLQTLPVCRLLGHYSDQTQSDLLPASAADSAIHLAVSISGIPSPWLKSTVLAPVWPAFIYHFLITPCPDLLKAYGLSFPISLT